MVLQINFDDQVAWYYLGRAAEGLGGRDAAVRYYRRAKFHELACARMINVCDGLVFPAVVDERLQRLAPEPG
jgi:hypothetical protein